MFLPRGFITVLAVHLYNLCSAPSQEGQQNASVARVCLFSCSDLPGSRAGWSLLKGCEKPEECEGGSCSGCPREHLEPSADGLVKTPAAVLKSVHLEDFRARFIDAGSSSCVQGVHAEGFVCGYLREVGVCESGVDRVAACHSPRAV